MRDLQPFQHQHGRYPRRDPGQLVVDLRVPGDTELPHGRRIVVTEHRQAGGMAEAPAWRPSSMRPRLWVSAGAKSASGDRLAPLGMQGSKKVSDILVDAKVPVAQRAGLVCITDCRDSILWLPGLRMSRSAAITETTRSYYRVRLTQAGRGSYRS